MNRLIKKLGEKQKFRNLSKKNDIIQNKACMRNACNFKNNLPVVEMLVENGCVVTLMYIRNCVIDLSYNQTMSVELDVLIENN